MGNYIIIIMKFVIMALLGAITAVKLDRQESPDCPDSHQVFSYNEGMANTGARNTNYKGTPASAAGLVQFAEGMRGDEDLGQDITMKGQPFHYAQAKFAEGMRGDEDLGQDITMKGQPFHYNQRNNDLLVQFAEGMRGDEDLAQGITMKGQPFHYAQSKFAEGMRGD